MAGVGGFSIQTGSGGVLLSCRPRHCALAVCLRRSGSCWRGAVSTPGRWLQAGDACPWHRLEQLSLLSQLGFLGWVWTGMLGELLRGLGSELRCCLAAPLNLPLHIRSNLTEERSKFLSEQ